MSVCVSCCATPMDHRNLQAEAHVADERGKRIRLVQQRDGALDDVAQAAS